MACQLCSAINEKYRLVAENQHAFSIVIKEPLLDGHCLVLPKRHITRLEDLTPEESKDLHQLASQIREKIELVFGSSSLLALNGKKVATQAHIHYQVMPLPPGVGIRTLVSKTLNIPERAEANEEDLIKAAKMLR